MEMLGEGQALLEQKKWDEALAVYRAAVEEGGPEMSGAAWAMIGVVENMKAGGRPCEAAYGPFKRSVELDPNNAHAHLGLGGVLLHERKDYARAEEHLRAAIRLDPKNVDAHRGLAGVLKERGDFDGAIREMLEYVRKGDPDNDGEARREALIAAKAYNTVPAPLWGGARGAILSDASCPRQEENRIAFRNAASKGETDAVGEHISNGIYVNCRGRRGSTALCRCASAATYHKGLLDTAKSLILAGADVNLATNQGSTPLAWAAYNGHFHIAELLIMHNADKELADAQGKPIDQVCLARTADILHKGAITKLLR